jgi:hypothetical protein
MTSLRDQIAKTLQGWIDDFNTNTPEGLIANRTPGCKQLMMPESELFPPRSNDEYQAFMSPCFNFMKDFHLKLSDKVAPIIDAEGRIAAVHLTSNTETPVGRYINTYIFTLRFSEDGKQIDEVIEFGDTAATAAFVPKFLQYVQENTPKN